MLYTETDPLTKVGHWMHLLKAKIEEQTQH